MLYAPHKGNLVASFKPRRGGLFIAGALPWILLLFVFRRRLRDNFDAELNSRSFSIVQSIQFGAAEKQKEEFRVIGLSL